jgi:hypothetical protein
MVWIDCQVSGAVLLGLVGVDVFDFKIVADKFMQQPFDPHAA